MVIQAVGDVGECHVAACNRQAAGREALADLESLLTVIVCFWKIVELRVGIRRLGESGRKLKRICAVPPLHVECALEAITCLSPVSELRREESLSNKEPPENPRIGRAP